MLWLEQSDKGCPVRQIPLLRNIFAWFYQMYKILIQLMIRNKNRVTFFSQKNYIGKMVKQFCCQCSLHGTCYFRLLLFCLTSDHHVLTVRFFAVKKCASNQNFLVFSQISTIIVVLNKLKVKLSYGYLKIFQFFVGLPKLYLSYVVSWDN